MYERVKTAESQPLKEKYEEELKKEIKKLQRYRDQIKAWAASADVKNKAPLLEARRIIERKMEAFKVVERETKTKAYSKEGLARDQPLSAEERKRLKTREWVQDSVNKLNDQIDEFEAELEAMEAAGGGGGAKKKPGVRDPTEVLEGVVKTHHFHVDKLEAVRVTTARLCAVGRDAAVYRKNNCAIVVCNSRSTRGGDRTPFTICDMRVVVCPPADHPLVRQRCD